MTVYIIKAFRETSKTFLGSGALPQTHTPEAKPPNPLWRPLLSIPVSATGYCRCCVTTDLIVFEYTHRLNDKLFQK